MRSGDQRLRALEREAAAGDPGARLRWFRERLRLGRVERLPIRHVVAEALGPEEELLPNDLRNGLRAVLDQEGIPRRGREGLTIRINRDNACLSPRDWSHGGRPAIRRAAAVLGIDTAVNLKVFTRPLTSSQEQIRTAASLPPGCMGAFLDGYLRDRRSLIEAETPTTCEIGQVVRLRRPRARRRWIISAIVQDTAGVKLDLTALTGSSKYSEVVRPDQVVLDADQAVTFALDRLRRRHYTRRDAPN